CFQRYNPLTGTPNSLARSRMWPSFILSTAICLNSAGRRSHFRFAFLDIPFSYDVLSTPNLSCSSGPTNGRQDPAASELCICPLSLISVNLRNGPEPSRARAFCAEEENLFRV